jgi:hypothetical protein
MKFFLVVISVFAATALALTPILHPEPILPPIIFHPAVNSCAITGSGASQVLSLTLYLDTFKVTGSSRIGASETSVSLTVEDTSSSISVFTFNGNLLNGNFTSIYDFGPLIKGLHNFTLVNHGASTLDGSANGFKLSPFDTTMTQFKFSNGTNLVAPTLPVSYTTLLSQLPGAIKSQVGNCQTTSNTKRSWDDISPNPKSSLIKRQQFDQPGSGGNCAYCQIEAFAASTACVVGCIESFGFGCGCVAGIPLLFIQCNNPGDGFGQGCCPVACGPSSNDLGITVVYACCDVGDSCLDPTVPGWCCPADTTPCGGRSCCDVPRDGPCRDQGICCPYEQATCTTQFGVACCNPGEQCVQEQCCPTANIVGEQCVYTPVPCAAGSQSYCQGDGYQDCINGDWVHIPCQPGICISAAGHIGCGAVVP